MSAKNIKTFALETVATNPDPTSAPVHKATPYPQISDPVKILMNAMYNLLKVRRVAVIANIVLTPAVVSNASTPHVPSIMNPMTTAHRPKDVN